MGTPMLGIYSDAVEWVRWSEVSARSPIENGCFRARFEYVFDAA